MEQHLLNDVLLVLAIAVAAVALFSQLRLPAILGYLVVGVVIGPYTLGWLEHGPSTRFLGEIGVTLLLFSIGLEFPIAQLRVMKSTILGLGIPQVIIGTLTGALIVWSNGFEWQAAFIVGGALALSSTAIVIKQLSEQSELQENHGRLALGVLLLQDLAAVPFLVVIPILGASTDTSMGLSIGLALIKGLFALVFMLSIGHWALRPLLHYIARQNSQELFTLTVLLISLAAAWVTNLMGLSLQLGAFLAGMMIAETEFRHQIESEIRPFRDILLGLFFVTVGMHLDIFALPGMWQWILLLTVGIMFGKGIIIVLLARMIGNNARTSVRAGLVLGQGGEFGIALLTLALVSGVVSETQSQPVLAAIVLSMMIAPVIIRNNSKYVDSIADFLGEKVASTELIDDLHTSEFSEHVILCGYGHVGQNISTVLQEEGFKTVALDQDPERVRSAWETGEHVFFADGLNLSHLNAAGLDKACALIISFKDLQGCLHLIPQIRSHLPDLPILIRASNPIASDKLLDAGATEAIPEALETGLMLSSQALRILGIAPELIIERMETIRHNRYRSFRTVFSNSANEQNPAVSKFMQGIPVPENSLLVGKTLRSSSLHQFGVSVSGLIRDNIRGDEPAPEMVIESGDILILSGSTEELRHAENFILRA